MYTAQLKRALERNRETRRLWIEVLPRDLLPRRVPKRPTVIIANTDTSAQPGKHWVAFYFTDKCVWYFDSYGRPPMAPELKRMMTLRKQHRHFKRRIQGTGGVCGEYCLYFVLTRMTSMTFDCFGKDLEANDRIVKRVVKRYFYL
mgnify:CR=1 FL=1